MLIISKFPKSIVGSTKCPCGPRVVRMFETPDLATTEPWLSISNPPVMVDN